MRWPLITFFQCSYRKLCLSCLSFFLILSSHNIQNQNLTGVVTGSEFKSGKVSGPGLQNTQTPFQELFYPMNLLNGFVLLSSTVESIYKTPRIGTINLIIPTQTLGRNSPESGIPDKSGTLSPVESPPRKVFEMLSPIRCRF